MLRLGFDPCGHSPFPRRSSRRKVQLEHMEIKMKACEDGRRVLGADGQQKELTQDKGPYLAMGSKLLSARRFLWR